MVSRQHTELVWDTAVSLRLLAADDAPLCAAQEAIVRWLHRVDALLSPFRPDSDLSRWRAGDAELGTLAPEVTEVLDLAARAATQTGGCFDPCWAGGRADPTGLTKGWAVDRAVALARDLGVTDLQVNAGGDVRTAGRAPSGRPWRLGVEDPRGGPGLLDVVEGEELCVATSSPRHRGAHVWHAGRAAVGARSVTVIAADLAHADAYSTAGFAAGAAAPELLRRLADEEAIRSLVLLDDGQVWASPGWPGEVHG